MTSVPTKLKSRAESIHSGRLLFKAALGYGLLEIGSRAAQALAIFLLAYSFGKEEFGAFYVYLAIFQLVTVLATGGLLESMMRSLSRSDDRGSRRLVVITYSHRYASRAVIILIVSAIAVFAVATNKFNVAIQTFLAAVGGGLCYGLVILIASYLTCSGSNRRSMYLRFAYTVLSYTAATAAALFFRHVQDFFVGICAAGALTLLILLAVSGKTLRDLWIGRRGIRTEGGYEWFLVPALLNWFFWYGLVIFVSNVFGNVEAADLAFANNAASVLLVLNSAISQAWVSRYLGKIGVSREDIEIDNVRVFRFQSLLMIATAVIVLLGYEALSLLHFPLVQKYAQMGFKISVLLFSISVSSAYFGAINSFAVNARGAQLAFISLIAYFSSIAVLLWLSAGVGVLGIYMGLALLLISRGFTLTWYARKFLRAGFVDFRLIALNCFIFALTAAYYLAR